MLLPSRQRAQEGPMKAGEWTEITERRKLRRGHTEQCQEPTVHCGACAELTQASVYTKGLGIDLHVHHCPEAQLARARNTFAMLQSLCK